MEQISKLRKLIISIIVLINACTAENNSSHIEQLKNEIINTEVAFADLAKQEGVAKAFNTFADEDAVLNRNNTLIKGKKAIKAYFENQTLQNIKLIWKTDFVDVAKSGDLAYTYGNYVFSAIDSNGQKINSEGVFHTVWKRQPDGIWKYVWD